LPGASSWISEVAEDGDRCSAELMGLLRVTKTEIDPFVDDLFFKSFNSRFEWNLSSFFDSSG